MKKIVKLILIVLMLIGLAFSVINLITVDNEATQKKLEGTKDGEDCIGMPLNCKVSTWFTKDVTFDEIKVIRG